MQLCFGQVAACFFLAGYGTIQCDLVMPRGIFARPFNITRSFRDFEWALPRRRGHVKKCPVVNREFEKYGVIELLDKQTVGEVRYYCPYCDALVIREFVSYDRRKTDILDPAHT